MELLGVGVPSDVLRPALIAREIDLEFGTQSIHSATGPFRSRAHPSGLDAGVLASAPGQKTSDSEAFGWSADVRARSAGARSESGKSAARDRGPRRPVVARSTRQSVGCLSESPRRQG